jgi:lipopolysaccharide/colanic/teichoic acid biosynthesis glycosyltransferase
VLKRLLDLVLSLSSLILLAAPLALIAIIVKLDSPGPVLFGQPRVGKRGRTFTMLKFRSMRRHSDQGYHLQQSARWFEGTPGVDGYKTASDPRITRVGRLLRRTSIDELPQLLNVVRGEMSLVGPRPMMPYDRPHYKDWYYERERVSPGITGLWQVSGRHRISAEAMMELDVRYVRERSLWLDLKILVRTVPALLGY